MTGTPFDSLSEPLPRRLAAGLARLAVALRSGQWQLAEAYGLTPTQAQVLALVAARAGSRRPAPRISEIAAELAVTRPTAGDAVATLERKQLLVRAPDARDGRAVGLVLTDEGKRLARQAGDWPASLLQAAHDLPEPEQAILLRTLIRLIRGLQLQGAIAPARMCATCRFFRPHAHPDQPATPHHCAFVDAPFGDRHLRLDCAEQEPLAPADAAPVWDRFISPPGITRPPP